ncbi:DUF1156 domain-containing protein [Leptolyngbya sp. FACHB-17]|uniref:DUF1156 domain-containing protein n=1 Tax=unclassified Leptolyngbya TaxID=2650499 RepID=UPI001681BCA6|nr:DUF1156 domain-containing protein [Leptolyngbya sp. FACHB-17]MBD2078378.1 DUF1156 domain-containing protein [Leptolyngbya sp. FACHB-17]
MARKDGKKKKEWLAEEVAKAVGAGKAVSVETVDFSDPNRPKTCLEVDFPILPINQIATIEGNAGKPIYQMSKWWARRRSSVFRAMLLAASMKAPDDPAEAAKAVWDVYYANHQKKGALSHLKVADIFMGGGTTVVEGSRLGMQMFGCDLNPVAWFVVKNELAQVDVEEVKALLADIEAEVKPQIMPFYACDCPRGHKGKWTQISTGKVMGEEFDPLALTPEQRKDYRYQGPEIIYVFWAKHGPCSIRECGHRTPIMSSPVMAVKTLTVKAWEDRECNECGSVFDEERDEARMAPSMPLVVAGDEKPYAILDKDKMVTCPHCKHRQNSKGIVNQKWKNKKVSLHLLVHPEWLAGSPKTAPDGTEYGGSAMDLPEVTAAWNYERASKIKLIEVRGVLPDEITCPETGINIKTKQGTVPKKSNFTCGSCGIPQDILTAVKATKKTAPIAMYAIQGYCPNCDKNEKPYSGRFFAPVNNSSIFDAANNEWSLRKAGDLAPFWPKSEIPFGFMTYMNNGGIPNHGYTHWWKMFNSRQLLVLSQLLQAIWKSSTDSHTQNVREFVLGAFQQYLRNQCMFAFWHLSRDHFAPALSSSNYHPKSTMIEVGVFSEVGYGSWNSVLGTLSSGAEWLRHPWELLPKAELAKLNKDLAQEIQGASGKVFCQDLVLPTAELRCSSSTDLQSEAPQTHDAVITDPPFGGLLHYSELSDFFYVWLRLVLKDFYPSNFQPEYTPKTLEVVANKARQPDEPDSFYQRLLTACWKEASRILKPGGILAFTFHHSLDEPWVAVLESLFDAGFYLEATYPIRSDETKGEGAKPGTIGSQKIEYDIVHVCRKRIEEPTSVSWGKMRREVLRAVQQLKDVLELHANSGLPAADLKMIKCGKALEYYSRHYGKVYLDEGKPISVKEALVGIIQLLDEDSNSGQEPPPVTAEPFTRQFLRIFDGVEEQPRDQMQKYLGGTTMSPKDFEERGWCQEQKKVYYLTPPLEIAKSWQGRHRQKLTSDYDQAMFLIGACFDGSGINVSDTLRNPNFRPHPALGALLSWHINHGASKEIQTAALRASQIYQAWERQHPDQAKQLQLEFGE